jgi:hypothetical protein
MLWLRRYIIIAVLTAFVFGCLFYAWRKYKHAGEALQEAHRNRTRRAALSSPNSDLERGKTNRIDPSQKPKIHDIFVRESLDTSQWRSMSVCLPCAVQFNPADDNKCVRRL